MKRFFIIGNPRSGTTLLRLMLNKHNAICVPPEAGFLVWLYNEYKQFYFSEKKIYLFIESLKKTAKIENWNLDYSRLACFLITEKPNSYSELIDSIYSYYKNSSLYGDKNNFYLSHIHTIKKIYPDAKFIHIIRDGRSVAASYINLNDAKLTSKYAPKLPYEIEDIAAEWKKNIITIDTALSNLCDSNYITVRFEDLVLNSTFTLNKLCFFLEKEYDKNMLYYYKTTKDEGLEPDEYIQWKEKTKIPLQKEEAFKYKQLSKSDLILFEKLTKNILSKYNYISNFK